MDQRTPANIRTAQDAEKLAARCRRDLLHGSVWNKFLFSRSCTSSEQVWKAEEIWSNGISQSGSDGPLAMWFSMAVVGDEGCSVELDVSPEHGIAGLAATNLGRLGSLLRMLPRSMMVWAVIETHLVHPRRGLEQGEGWHCVVEGSGVGSKVLRGIQGSVYVGLRLLRQQVGDIEQQEPALHVRGVEQGQGLGILQETDQVVRVVVHQLNNTNQTTPPGSLSNREFENRAAIIVALRAGRSPKEIVDFLKLPKTTIYRVKKQFDEADSNKEGIATRKKHSRRSDREKIDGNPGKSMRAIAKEMDVGSMTIVRTIHEDLGLKSYALRKGQLLTENMKNNRKGKAAALLNNLKHDSFGMLRFFSDEKNFDVDQKVNPRNDRWICKDPSEIPVVMHTKFPASVMVLGVISSEGDVMPPHFFEKGLRMNADTYINVLETVVKPWMDMVAAGRKYVFQQDSAPAHKAKKTQSWLTLNVPSHWGPDIWPPNSPDCNPLDYYVWGVVERDVNKAPHTTIQSVKKAVHTVMTQMDKVIVAKACASFRIRLETVRFKEGREETADNECSGRPSTSTTPEKVDKVLELVHEARRITVREVAEEAGISLGSTKSIMKDKTAGAVEEQVSIEEIKVESKKAMKAIPKTDYQRCFADWKKRWLKCIVANGDYFEGDNLNFL
ncbi:hypothetical protein LAZ67_18001632 [Cordylochernes scorpioides]|uniref:Transposase n=1 Tax=Cordylochernes scorpioides TaxID=51811 RepID=A0ABY6LFW0_9ARAC|nr:hypothetical protein LAZ67_18001632 [Cordylochernes scorpioides]